MNDDPRLAIDGYNLIRCDNPTDTKKGGVCVYFREYLPLVRRSDLSNLEECLVLEVRSGRKRSFITVIYHSPSQTTEQFSLFRQK